MSNHPASDNNKNSYSQAMVKALEDACPNLRMTRMERITLHGLFTDCQTNTWQHAMDVLKDAAPRW